jgi:hypothetical protein
MGKQVHRDTRHLLNIRDIWDAMNGGRDSGLPEKWAISGCENIGMWGNVRTHIFKDVAGRTNILLIPHQRVDVKI